MNPDKQRIAIAEACGWTECHPATKTPHGFFEAYGRKKLPCGSRKDERLPDYLNDLNAMHEAEYHPSITCNYPRYVREIAKLLPASDSNTAQFADLAVCHATAAQRAEAFLRTVGKWEGAK